MGSVIETATPRARGTFPGLCARTGPRSRNGRGPSAMQLCTTTLSVGHRLGTSTAARGCCASRGSRRSCRDTAPRAGKETAPLPSRANGLPLAPLASATHLVERQQPARTAAQQFERFMQRMPRCTIGIARELPAPAPALPRRPTCSSSSSRSHSRSREPRAALGVASPIQMLLLPLVRPPKVWLCSWWACWVLHLKFTLMRLAASSSLSRRVVASRRMHLAIRADVRARRRPAHLLFACLLWARVARPRHSEFSEVFARLSPLSASSPRRISTDRAICRERPRFESCRRRHVRSYRKRC